MSWSNRTLPVLSSSVVQSGQAHDVVGVAAAVAERFSAPMVCVVVDPALLSAGMRADGSEIIEPIDPDTADSDPQQLPDDDVRVIHGLLRRGQWASRFSPGSEIRVTHSLRWLRNVTR